MFRLFAGSAAVAMAESGAKSTAMDRERFLVVAGDMAMSVRPNTKAIEKLSLCAVEDFNDSEHLFRCSLSTPHLVLFSDQAE